MTKHSNTATSRALLDRVRLGHFLSEDGRPTEACWKRIDEDTLSTTEKVLVALALELVDFTYPIENRQGEKLSRPWIGGLMALDNGNLRAVAHALLAMAGESPADFRATSLPELATRQGFPSLARAARFTFLYDGNHLDSVDSIEAAVAAWERYRDESGGGVSDIGNGGVVQDADGRIVARISYNGRVKRSAQ